MRRWLWNNGTTLTFLLLALLFFAGHALTGHAQYNEDRQDHGRPAAGFVRYLFTGHFIESVGENWESEFLQMFAYVLLTVWLRQKGSAESKKLEGEDPVDEDPRRHRRDPGAPWPVRRGGWVLKVYEHSLSLSLLLLFVFSVAVHAYGGLRHQCEEQAQHGGSCASMAEYLAGSRFWFESLQNWQSEFLSVGALVWLSIYLRERGSPESKPVHASYEETGH